MRLFAGMITALLFIGSGISHASRGPNLPQAVEQQNGVSQDKKSEAPPASAQSVPKPNADGVYQVGNGVSAPQITYSIDPELTDAARRKKLTGTCIVSLVVDTRGIARDRQVSTSIADTVPPKLRSIATELDRNAVNAVKMYRFKPGMYQGKPVPVETTVGINYRLY
jgi:hypothetical protein